jgi:hypothetical protein
MGGSFFTTSFGSIKRSGDLVPPSPPAEKAPACQDQAGKTSTGDGTGNRGGGYREIIVGFKTAMVSLSGGVVRFDNLGNQLARTCGDVKEPVR